MALPARQATGWIQVPTATPLGPFIADFFCQKVNLVVELDGDSHAERAIYDDRRTVRLERDGYFVIRFFNDDVWHLDAVLQALLDECERLTA
jgi:very-short-patch-repair endonuclease